MRNLERVFTRTLITLAVLAAFAPAYGQEADADALKRPDSSVSLGVGITPGDAKDRTIWGQYNGMREGGSHLLFDVDVNKRDDSGFWTILRGRNLGLDNRDVGLTLQQQGDWRLNAEYSELVHREIRTINSGISGAGTTTPQIVRLAAPGAGSDLNFNLKRQSLALGGDKWISNNLQIEVNFKSEDKNGTRMWARGYDCNATYVCTGTQDATHQKWALIPVPEPVNFNIKQVDAKLNFTSGKLFVTGGYYGTFFTNANGAVTPIVPNALNGPTGVLTTLNPAVAAGQFPTGGTSLQNVLQLPMALYPENQAHQFYLSGNYAWTQSTKSNFKLGYTHATQDQSFSSMGLSGAPAGRNDLGGALDTLLAQFNMTSRMSTNLTLLGNVRYEKR
ncbi:MAG: MtrB/PioB family outer membrane beta-barrel protein, partial [Betaproteobacteria bacterium]|nr:MtrB/PioB family outer membrane beta-barrel protein [Betaproteobacteria bacterium]MBV9360286.1 MtrB/PioB family outer membrane beta-barrel protein [Betaproteobacteria bacterium]